MGPNLKFVNKSCLRDRQMYFNFTRYLSGSLTGLCFRLHSLNWDTEKPLVTASLCNSCSYIIHLYIKHRFSAVIGV